MSQDHGGTQTAHENSPAQGRKNKWDRVGEYNTVLLNQSIIYLAKTFKTFPLPIAVTRVPSTHGVPAIWSVRRVGQHSASAWIGFVTKPQVSYPFILVGGQVYLPH